MIVHCFHLLSAIGYQRFLIPAFPGSIPGAPAKKTKKVSCQADLFSL
jgi:hypothetical protein